MGREEERVTLRGLLAWPNTHNAYERASSSRRGEISYRSDGWYRSNSESLVYLIGFCFNYRYSLIFSFYEITTQNYIFPPPHFIFFFFSSRPLVLPESGWERKWEADQSTAEGRDKRINTTQCVPLTAGIKAARVAGVKVILLLWQSSDIVLSDYLGSCDIKKKRKTRVGTTKWKMREFNVLSKEKETEKSSRCRIIWKPELL